LRLREKGVPNASMPAVYDSDFAHDLDGKLVHVVVTDSKVTVTAATLDDAQAYWDAHQPHVGPIVADLSVTRVTSFDTLRAADKTAFGAKAANLGELTRVLDVPARNDGFAIPFAAYAHFMTVTGLDAEVESLLADPALRTDASVKHRLLKTLRDDIKSAPFPPELVDELRTMIAQVYGDAGTTQMLRYRSSTNVEDLDAFTGAGLYDSKSGCLADELDDDDAGPSRCLTDAGKAALESELARREAQLRDHPEYDWLLPILDDIEGDLANEKATSATIRKVWASLWNERAFDEREYYGIDHRLAYMGIAVNPTFVVEQASAVALSNLAVDDGAPLYQLNSQAGSESVVRPEDPTTVAELLTFRREGEPPEMTDVDVQVSSNLVPDGGPVWPANKLTELGSLLFRVHDYFAQTVYADISPLHLDFEVKLDAENHVVIKQVRPFVAAP
jgi:pyruvate,water dikinase